LAGLSLVEASAVVDDVERELPDGGIERHSDAPCLRVARRISEGFLSHSIDAEGHFVRDVEVTVTDHQFHARYIITIILSAQLTQCRHQTRMP
jgi:hypothetical protein